MTIDDDDPPTSPGVETDPVRCPKCNGEGIEVLPADGTTHRGRRCPMCDGKRVVDPEVARAWRRSSRPPPPRPE